MFITLANFFAKFVVASLLAHELAVRLDLSLALKLERSMERLANDRWMDSPITDRMERWEGYALEREHRNNMIIMLLGKKLHCEKAIKELWTTLKS